MICSNEIFQILSDALLGGVCEASKTGQCSDTAAQCLTNGTDYICTCGPNHFDKNGFALGGSCSSGMFYIYVTEWVSLVNFNFFCKEILCNEIIFVSEHYQEHFIFHCMLFSQL